MAGASENGFMASPKARPKCLSGKMSPSRSNQAGVSLPKGTKMLETNAIGSSVALAIGTAIDTDRASAANPRPSAANEADPTAKVKSMAGTLAASTFTP